MPARRRHRGKPDQQVIDDPVTRFGMMLRESAERERAEKERKQQRKRDAAAAAEAARAHADALRNAQRDLERAIENVKVARARRSGVAEADAAWRDAKARLIELQTGAAPEWAPAAGDQEPAGDEVDDDEANAGQAIGDEPTGDEDQRS